MHPYLLTSHGTTSDRTDGAGGMKFFFAIFWITATAPIVAPIQAQVNVTQEHNHISRDGLYVDSAFTRTAAANLRRDLNFNGTILGSVYGQPLYIENGPGGAAMIIVATETNDVYALNAGTGNVIWHRHVGAAVTSGLPSAISTRSASQARPSSI